MDELWTNIPGFPNYDISNRGEIYNLKREILMQRSLTREGYPKISLLNASGDRITCSIPIMVADCFVDPPDRSCDRIVALDGNKSNTWADNLVWRPGGYAWRYTRQLKETQPDHYKNLQVANTRDDILYDSIIEAGMSEGVLYDHIWKSTYTSDPVPITWSVYEIVE